MTAFARAIEGAIIGFAAAAFDWKVGVLSFLWLWLMNVREHITTKEQP